jgi:hypothetical protein
MPIDNALAELGESRFLEEYDNNIKFRVIEDKGHPYVPDKDSEDSYEVTKQIAHALIYIHTFSEQKVGDQKGYIQYSLLKEALAPKDDSVNRRCLIQIIVELIKEGEVEILK